jgi:hypothetical protein
MSTFNTTSSGRIALAVTVSALLGILTLSLMVSGLPFFGPVNDLINAGFALFSAILAWQFNPLMRQRAPNSARYYLLVAWAGAAAIVINSVLVASGQMDWMTGAMYTGIGYGLFGVWLLALNRMVTPQLFESTSIPRLGVITAAGMMSGLLAGPMLAMQANLADNPLVSVVFMGTAAGYLLYPLWTWMLGRRLLREPFPSMVPVD